MAKILIVDDSNFSQKTLANLLKKYLNDAEFLFADNGEVGFDKYKEQNPDYVFVDLLMPKINGKQLIKLIKEYDSNAKIIVVSADVQKSVRDEIEKFNIISFINKPFNDENALSISNLIRNDKNE